MRKELLEALGKWHRWVYSRILPKSRVWLLVDRGRIGPDLLQNGLGAVGDDTKVKWNTTIVGPRACLRGEQRCASSGS